MLRKSIKFQVLVALIIQIAALLGIVLTSLYLINLRQHDYLILNLSGQLRVLTRNIITQSEHYIEQAPRDYTSYNRDLGLYHRDLQMQIAAFDEIVQSLKSRSIKANLITHHPVVPANEANKVPTITSNEVLICKWNASARHQMDDTAAVWEKFHKGLIASLGQDADGPRLEAAAEYISRHGHMLTETTTRLSTTFRAMMEEKLDQIKFLNQLGVVIIFIISIFIVVILYRLVFRPIDNTVSGFTRVARGELNYQVPVYRENEIGNMTRAFNDLTARLSSLFRLTDRINQANNLDETLHYAYQEFPGLLPVEWIAILRMQQSNSDYHMDRVYSKREHDLTEQESFSFDNSLFAYVIRHDELFCSCIDDSSKVDWQADAFIKRLRQNQLQSIVYLPMSTNQLETAVLVLATDIPQAYDHSHVELLGNIAGLISNSFEKTIGMESLVISTVKGLAKLAESRDPETGDHLFRMSQYSALIAKQLGKNARHASTININYVRDVLTFSPMHDIGKVGISDAILLKPGKLNDEEFSIMQQHPLIGGEVLRRCEKQMNAVGRSVFKIGIEIAEGHHEKYNGRGYPNQLKGDEIPLSARIVAVADVFDALTSKRPYKEAWPVEKALELLRSESGQHFDPDVINAFHDALPEIMNIYEKYKHV